MKKRIIYSMIILLCLSAELRAQRTEKNIEESFSVNAETILDIDSKFGEVRVLEWNEDRVEVKADIWVESNNKETAEKLLAELDAKISKTDNRIIVESILPPRLTTNKKTQFRIDFEILAPASIDLELSSKYGSAYLEKISGHADISIAYGNLKIRELHRENEKPLNSIDLAYSSGNIEEAGWLKMDLAYSKLSMSEAHALMAISRYSSLSVDETSSVVIDSKYDTYSLGELNNFLGEMKFGNLKIGEVRKQFDIESGYTSVGVEEITESFESVKIDNNRGGYKLGLSENASFTLNGYASRGDIVVEGMQGLNKKTENSDKYVEGSYGNNPKSKIEIDVKNGSVKIHLK